MKLEKAGFPSYHNISAPLRHPHMPLVPSAPSGPPHGLHPAAADRMVDEAAPSPPMAAPQHAGSSDIATPPLSSSGYSSSMGFAFGDVSQLPATATETESECQTAVTTILSNVEHFYGDGDLFDVDRCPAFTGLPHPKFRPPPSQTPYFDISSIAGPSARAIQQAALDSVDLRGTSSQICAHRTALECAQMRGSRECCSDKVHARAVYNPVTNVDLGDCPFLDTCFDKDRCQYVHYDLAAPAAARRYYELLPRFVRDAHRTSLVGTGKTPYAGPKRTPAQWIREDIMALDLTVLGRFAAVVIDPPWEIHMNLPYEKCSDGDISRLQIDRLVDNGLVFLWVTQRTLDTGIDFLHKWGCRLETQILWTKTNQLWGTVVTGRTGHWFNHAGEMCLVGRKGNPSFWHRGVDLNCIVSPMRETSRKPDELYEMVERLVGVDARKLELFGRQHNIRDGWLTVGNQVPPTQITEPEVQEAYNAFKPTERARQSQTRQPFIRVRQGGPPAVSHPGSLMDVAAELYSLTASLYGDFEYLAESGCKDDQLAGSEEDRGPQHDQGCYGPIGEGRPSPASASPPATEAATNRQRSTEPTGEDAILDDNGHGPAGQHFSHARSAVNIIQGASVVHGGNAHDTEPKSNHLGHHSPQFDPPQGDFVPESLCNSPGASTASPPHLLPAQQRPPPNLDADFFHSELEHLADGEHVDEEDAENAEEDDDDDDDDDESLSPSYRSEELNEQGQRPDNFASQHCGISEGSCPQNPTNPTDWRYHGHHDGYVDCVPDERMECHVRAPHPCFLSMQDPAINGSLASASRSGGVVSYGHGQANVFPVPQQATPFVVIEQDSVAAHNRLPGMCTPGNSVVGATQVAGTGNNLQPAPHEGQHGVYSTVVGGCTYYTYY